MSPDNTRYISAHYIVAQNALLKRGIITVVADGTIIDVEDTGGCLAETRSVEFYDGIIIPGFVNCHCHLELSTLKGSVPQHTGLPDFLAAMRRLGSAEKDPSKIRGADQRMYDNGVEVCADICNTDATFEIKKSSKIIYHNLIEVMGTNPAAASERITGAGRLVASSLEAGIPCSVVPHSAYTVSLPLLRMIKSFEPGSALSSMHFMESAGEGQLLSERSGNLASSLMVDGLLGPLGSVATSHLMAVEEGVENDRNLILVHNTFADPVTVGKLVERGNVFWCLCPNSNLYIENEFPPVKMLLSNGAVPVVGTDSLASNNDLDILGELKTLQKHFPDLNLTELVGWATINGAKALKVDNLYGSITPGKRPGLLLLEGPDLWGNRLLESSTIKRLI